MSGIADGVFSEFSLSLIYLMQKIFIFKRRECFVHNIARVHISKDLVLEAMYILEDNGLGTVELSDRKQRPIKFMKVKADDVRENNELRLIIKDLGLNVTRVVEMLDRQEDVEMITARSLHLI